MNTRILLPIVLLVGGVSLAVQFGIHFVPAGGFFCNGEVNTFGMTHLEIYKKPCVIDTLKGQMEVLRRALKNWPKN